MEEKSLLQFFLSIKEIFSTKNYFKNFRKYFLVPTDFFKANIVF